MLLKERYLYNITTLYNDIIIHNITTFYVNTMKGARNCLKNYYHNKDNTHTCSRIFNKYKTSEHAYKTTTTFY